VQIRDASPEDMAEVGEIRITAYEAGGFLSADAGYKPHLRALGADGNGHVLVAVAPGRQETDGTSSSGAGERVVGTVMLQAWPNAGPTVHAADEAEIRALAVRPEAQGSGAGWQLVVAVIERARRTGVRHLVLCTEPEMRTAHRLYERAGFVRLPERDWSPAPSVTLLVYGLKLG
jgi:ribosomal protein S18 acetylase RimI-like enzyme